jgi:hypothetical protein
MAVADDQWDNSSASCTRSVKRSIVQYSSRVPRPCKQIRAFRKYLNEMSNIIRIRKQLPNALPVKSGLQQDISPLVLYLAL